MQNFRKFSFSFIYVWLDRAWNADHEYILFISIWFLFGGEKRKKVEWLKNTIFPLNSFLLEKRSHISFIFPLKFLKHIYSETAWKTESNSIVLMNIQFLQLKKISWIQTGLSIENYASVSIIVNVSSFLL